MQRLHRFRFGGQSARLGFSFRSGSTALDHWWRCVHAIDAAPTGTIALHRPRCDLIIDRFDGAAGRHQAKVISFSAIRSVAGHGVYDFVRARKIQTEALPATLATLAILKSERWASTLAVCFFFFILRIHLSQECKHLVRHLAGHGIKLSKSFADSRLNGATP